MMESPLTGPTPSTWIWSMTGHFQVWFPPPQLAPDAPPGVPLKLTDRKPLYVPSPCSQSR